MWLLTENLCPPTVLSQNKRPHNIETFEDNHKKFGMCKGLNY